MLCRGTRSLKLSISEAARRAGVRRTTIYRKFQTGKLSRETDDDGNPVIDLAELSRLYPYAVTDPGHKPKTHNEAERDNTETAALRELIAVLKNDKERLAIELDRVRTEARAEVERERSERERLLALLENAQRQLNPPPRQGWFTRFRRH